MPQYNVIVYDFPGIDRNPKRQLHFAEVPRYVNSGVLLAGGAIYRSDDCLTDSFAGLWLHVEAESREAVIEFLKQDPYATEGVWDVSTAIIHPMTAAVRLPVKFPNTDDKVYQV